MSQERELERVRAEIIEAMDWIDAERKRLSRRCFAETRQKWHGERERGREITRMKKWDEWLYRRRCRLRERIGDINAALKDARRAQNGTVSRSFGSVFVEVARRELPEEAFAAVLQETVRLCGSEGPPEAGPETATRRTVLQEVRQDLEAFMAADSRPRPQAPGKARETQADFRLDAAGREGGVPGLRRAERAAPVLRYADSRAT